MIYSLYIGESAGVKALNFFIKKKKKISYVFSLDKQNIKQIKSICKKNKIKLFLKLPKNLNKIQKLTSRTNFIINIFSRFIIPNEILKKVKKSSFNIHPGRLPYYPGTNSVAGEIFNNEKYSALSVHEMNNKIDGGNILFIKKVKINNNDLAIDVWRKLFLKLNHSIDELINKLEKKKIKLQKNIYAKRKFFPKYIPNNGIIKKNYTKKKLLKLYKAGNLYPYKSSWGYLKFVYKNKVYIIKNLKIKKKKYKTFIIKKQFDDYNFILNTNNNTIYVYAIKNNEL